MLMEHAIQVRIEELLEGPISWFEDWPDGSVPRSGRAAYTIWDREGRLVYAGMSGRSATAATGSRGPFGRLNSHASGRRSGDQFCIYVCDRLVLPRLHNRLAEIASGALSLNRETKLYIRKELGFRLLTVSSPAEAFAVEKRIHTGGTPLGLPLLNPHWAPES
jgi:hypothetical protein